MYFALDYSNLLDEVPGVARKKNRFFKAFVTPRLPKRVHKKFQPIRSCCLAGHRERTYTQISCLIIWRI